MSNDWHEKLEVIMFTIVEFFIVLVAVSGLFYFIVKANSETLMIIRQMGF